MKWTNRLTGKAATLLFTAMTTITLSATAQAFCGFYVARADTGLYNEASQVVLVRDGNRTVLTMANDFSGKVEDFAMVIPVPTFIEREQINVGDRALIEHLDAYTSPRLVEYFDPDPCQPVVIEELAMARSAFQARCAPIADAAPPGRMLRTNRGKMPLPRGDDRVVGPYG